MRKSPCCGSPKPWKHAEWCPTLRAYWTVRLLVLLRRRVLAR